MDKDQFIAETSAKILASMFLNPEKDPSEKVAVQFAIHLWDELLAQGICPDIES